MKKYFSIALLFIYSFSVFQLNEYLKLPVLVEHFYEHQQENPKLDIFSFFINHYSLENNQPKDTGKDNKLPFKSHNDTCCSNANVYFLNQIQNIVFENKSFFRSFKKPNFGFTFTFISKFNSTIWQPPKIC